jgi:phage terminase small subunit
MQELEKAQFEVNEFENYIDVIRSIHKECGESWHWQEIKSSNPPEQPQARREAEMKVQKAFDKYSPSFFDKIFHKIGKKKSALLKEIEKAKKADAIELKKAFEEYSINYQEWKTLTEIANKICAGNAEAFNEAIKEVNPFEEIEQIGSSIKFSVVNKNLIECNLNVRDEKVIPKEEKSLLKSGKLSVKQIPTSRFYDIYQDYVCGCVLRIARELFALLPVEMALINSHSRLLNTKTGNIEDMPILSVMIPRITLEGLNFDAIDPSDSMKNFVHRMNFKKGQGFNPVEILNPSDFQK